MSKATVTCVLIVSVYRQTENSSVIVKLQINDDCRLSTEELLTYLLIQLDLVCTGKNKSGRYSYICDLFSRPKTNNKINWQLEFHNLSK